MSVLIGRRELFAFAERYSSCRLKDYTDLADGAVLCSLFNLVFPDLRIRTASPQTHSVSQRTQMNWAALRSALDDVGIPQSLLDQDAIQAGDTEKGFSALVLFYFIYHLTKRTDFSAEFAIDVTEVLTEFLQSIDSIAALVTGGALPLSAVPPQLQEQLRVATSARRRRSAARNSQTRKQRERSASSVSSSSVSEKEEDDVELFERRLSFDSHLTPVEPPQLLEVDTGCSGRMRNEATVRTFLAGQSPEQESQKKNNNGITKNKKSIMKEINVGNTPSHTMSSRSDDARRGGEEVEEEDALGSTAVMEREVKLQQALIAKSEECEKLKMQRLELLSQLAKLRTEKSVNSSFSVGEEKDATKRKLEEEQHRVMVVEEELMYLRRILNQTKEERRKHVLMKGSFTEDLLKDIVDTETGEVFNVHETATLLHGSILDALRDSPKRRHEAQRLLWLIVSAYHVVETRLVTACDLATVEFERLENNRNNNNSNNSNNNNSGRGGDCIPDSFAEFPSTPSTTAKPMRSYQKSSPSSLSGDATAPTLYMEISKLMEERESRQKQHEQQLTDLHTNEKNLLKRIHQLEDHLRRFAKKAIEREVKWKSLSAALHEAERTSFGIAEAETTEEVERLLSQRQAWYARADEESAILMQEGKDDALDLSTSETAGDSSHDVCEAMQTLVLSVTQDRDRLQREVEELRKKMEFSSLAAVHFPEKNTYKRNMKDEIHNRILEQKEYEEDEAQLVQTDSRPPYTLSCSSKKRTTSTPHSTERVSDRDDMTPFARNLSALLASASPM